MRFKLILSVRSESFGNVLPVSYQYELSSCINRKITDQRDLYDSWLQLNGFTPEVTMKYRLFSISNFYIPRIKVDGDRLNILARHIQLWISFLPERGTSEFIRNIFKGQTLLIGDRHTQVELEVTDIVECPDVMLDMSTELQSEVTIDYVSLSPIVFVNVRSNKSVEYVGPDSPLYTQLLIQSLLNRYNHFYGQDFPDAFDFDFEVLTEPKRKGIFIKRFTPEEAKIIGYMYKFRLTIHPLLHKMLYNTGLGDKISLGFGCVEVLR